MKEIATGLYQIPLLPRNSINAYLIDGYLIDAGIRSSGKKLLQAIDAYGRDKIKAHVLTHAHPDHNGASAFICDTLQIPLWCGEKDVPVMESGNVTESFPNPDSLMARFQQRFMAGAKYPVTRALEEGDWVGEFQVIDAPGHSPGHIALWREPDGALIVGDVLFNMNLWTTQVGLREPPAMFTSDVRQNQASIIKVANLRPKVVCFGHGPPLYETQKLSKMAQELTDG
jgi:glyoxylase-like metal-dependent hydrolase (beta-lactamase superfamily II)